jgi:Fur family ferric uptake transcriptional regulator
MTRQKQALSSLLDRTGEFTSAQDLHARLRGSGERIGLTTVYTQLRALAESGEVDTVRSENGEALYRRCTTHAHHHHLVCRKCGRAVEFDAPELETWSNRLARRHGFKDSEHVMEISGLCETCG